MVTLTQETMEQKIDQHFGFEACVDVEGVLTTLAPDVTHEIVGFPAGPTHGRENAPPFYDTLFAELEEGKVTCTRRLYGDNFLVDESVWEGKAPGRPFGIEGKGRPLQCPLLHVIEFTEDGQIQRENVWVDLAAIIQQLPQD